jgi:hypothetical protein
MSSLFRRLGYSLALLLATAGCGRQHSDGLQPAPFAPSESAPVPPPASEKQNELDTLEHDLAVSEERLAGYLAGRGSELRAETSKDDAARGREEGETSTSAEAPATELGRRPAAKPKKSDARPADGAGAAAPAPLPTAPAPDTGSACDLACQALSSMRRSADRICAIAGESDPRCARARARVEDAVGRVSRASCACRGND